MTPIEELYIRTEVPDSRLRLSRMGAPIAEVDGVLMLAETMRIRNLDEFCRYLKDKILVAEAHFREEDFALVVGVYEFGTTPTVFPGAHRSLRVRFGLKAVPLDRGIA